MAAETANLDEQIADILARTKTIAIVGASGNWKRPSNFVMKYLQEAGYRVIPVNPGFAGKKILGENTYATLADIPDSVDMVDVFRPAKEAPDLARQAIAIGAKTLWLQLAIVSEEAAKIGEAAGLTVIMNHCPKIEHSRLSGSLGLIGFDSKLLTSRRRPVKRPPAPARAGGFFQSTNLETLAIHAGAAPDPNSGARTVPIVQSTSFVFDDADHAASLFNLQTPGNIYGRLSNPTNAALEQKLAALEGGRGTTCCASGHAAQIIALLPLMGPGTRLVAANRLYGGSVTQFGHTFKKFGWQASFVDVDDLDAVRDAVAQEDVRALFVESLANPGGVVSDLEPLAELAHAAGIPFIVDNTMATPVLCKPFDHGADIIVHSTTKFLSGHANAMGGAVIDSGRFDWGRGRGFPALVEPEPAYHGISFWESFGDLAYTNYGHAVGLRDLGPTMAPLNAFLTLTGIETLPLRMERHVANAAQVVAFLAKHPKVKSVSHAGLPESPWHALAQKYLPAGAGSVFTFEVEGGYEAGKAVVAGCNIFSHLANIGDTRSLILHPASTTHRQLTQEQRDAAGVSEGVLRLSIGLENVEDLIADLDAALTYAA
ncbi:MAG: PLP-dependent transferase [Magnetospiraceae bacterium]